MTDLLEEPDPISDWQKQCTHCCELGVWDDKFTCPKCKHMGHKGNGSKLKCAACNNEYRSAMRLIGYLK